MTGVIEPFTAGRLDDAVGITRRMFGYDCTEVLHRIFENPLLGPAVSSGEVAYQDGCCVGFQAAILRDLYCGTKRFRGVVGSTLVMAPEASPVLLLNLMKSTIAPRAGSLIFFANTANVKSMKMNQLLGVKGYGPASCEKIRFSVLKPGSFVRFVTHGLFPHFLANCADLCFRIFPRGRVEAPIEVVTNLKVADFDHFWTRYLMFNKGLVSSRSGAELLWAFGEGIQSGRNVMLVWRDENGIEGFVVARTSDDEGLRWRIADWIAVQDDRHILSALLNALVRFLRTRRNAGVLESIGFNDSIQDVLRRCLPWTRKAPNNSFLWKITDCEFGKVCQPSFSSDWFWGPYDGDRFMN